MGVDGTGGVRSVWGETGGWGRCMCTVTPLHRVTLYRVNACAATLFPQSVYIYKDTALCRVEVCAQSLLSME